MSPHFIADVHLGRLARALRMMGFDTLYHNTFTKKELLDLALDQNRIVLSKDPAFEKNLDTYSFIKIKSYNWMEQLQQVITTCKLENQIAPFTRCMVCNGLLVMVNKEKVADKLEPNTRRFYHEFWQCQNCTRIYWKGPHYNRMNNIIKQLKGNTNSK